MAYPQNEKIDPPWSYIQMALAAGDGARARDLLKAAREDDRGIYNALYWRTTDWLKSRIARGPVTPGEERAGLTMFDVGEVRLQGFLNEHKKWPWQIDDLPYLMQEIRKS